MLIYLPSTHVYICRSNRRQRRSFGEPSVLKRLSMAPFYAPWRDGEFGPFCNVCEFESSGAQIVDSDPGEFSQKKCAIERHLSTEGSPKLRLWRLFDRQIYTCVLGKITVSHKCPTNVRCMAPPRTERRQHSDIHVCDRLNFIVAFSYFS